MSDVDAAVERLVAQLHRRRTHFDVGLADGPSLVRHQVSGEILGLRSALGLVLGHRAPEDVAAGESFYRDWLTTPAARFGACDCVRCHPSPLPSPS